MKTSFKRSTSGLALALGAIVPFAAWAQVGVSITVAPPPLPYYAQPPIPGDGYIWTPGYWFWDAAVNDYEWVPGTWVLPPQPGFLWTPGYWGFVGGAYGWHHGYWGNHVGYYGGLNYGYGYGGHGYDGGRWDHGHFRYNQAVNNLPQGRVHNVYNHPMPSHEAPGRESFNGGESHFHGQPTAAEHRYENAPHGEPTREQTEHEHRAATMPEQRMGNNHGMPPTAATGHPGGFGEPEVERGRTENEMHAPQMQHGGEPAGRPQGGAPMGRPEGGRPEGGRPEGGRPEGGHPEGGHPQGGHAEGGHPGGGERGGDRR